MSQYEPFRISAALDAREGRKGRLPHVRPAELRSEHGLPDRADGMLRDADIPAWVCYRVDRTIELGLKRPDLSIAALTREAFATCQRAAWSTGEAAVPYHVIARMVRSRMTPLAGRFRRSHVTEGRPLGEVVILRQTVPTRPGSQMGTEVHLTLASDTYSGRIVGARAEIRLHEADDILALFGNQPETDDPTGAGIVRRCTALPCVLVLDHGRPLAACHRHWAMAHNIGLRFRQVHPSSEVAILLRVRRHLEAACGETGREAVPVDALNDWLEHHDASRRGGGQDAPADRWREGVARYPLRYSADA